MDSFTLETVTENRRIAGKGNYTSIPVGVLFASFAFERVQRYQLPSDFIYLKVCTDTVDCQWSHIQTFNSSINQADTVSSHCQLESHKWGHKAFSLKLWAFFFFWRIIIYFGFANTFTLNGISKERTRIKEFMFKIHWQNYVWRQLVLL